MENHTPSAGPPPPYPIDSPLPNSDPTATEPIGLSPRQRRWNMEWLNEDYAPCIRSNDSRMERLSRRNRNYCTCKKTRPGTDQFMPNAIEASLANPRFSLKQARILTWPVRMLASNIKGLWGRWRKHRKNAKTLQMVVVMEEHGETPRWKGEMKLTFKDRHPFDYSKSKDGRSWNDFPSAQDIKWYLIRTPSGIERLQGGQDAQQWGPSTTAESCIPFVTVNGQASRHCTPHNFHEVADGNVFDNFVRPCPNCHRRS